MQQDVTPKERLIRAVQELHNAQVKPEVNARNAQCHQLIEEYVTETGQWPNSKTLERMGDYILVDDLTKVHKRRDDHEYSFHTRKQTERRQKRETSMPEESQL